MREDGQLFLQTTTRPINKFSGRLGPTPDSAGLAVLLGPLEPVFSVEGHGGGTTAIPGWPLSQMLPTYCSYRPRSRVGYSKFPQMGPGGSLSPITGCLLTLSELANLGLLRSSW